MKKIVFFLLAAAVVLITACNDKLDKDKFTYIVKADVTSVELNKTTLKIPKNSTATLKASVKPDRAVNQTVAWSSSNTNIATVNSEGEVSGIAEGTATVTVTTEDGGFKANCEVTVVLEGVSGVELNKDELTLLVGEEETLEATVSSEYADNKAVIWSSDDDDVATVDQKGKVTGVGPGTTTITVTTEEGEEEATCEVTVIQPVESVELNETEVEIEIGETVTLTATVYPLDATNQNVRWTISSAGNSNNVNVAFDKETGELTVTCVGYNTTVITVITEDGEKTATCKFFDPLFLLTGTDSKVWTWDFDAPPEDYGPWAMGAVGSGEPDWWSPDPENYEEDEYEGATMTFSRDGSLVKTKTDDSEEEGAFTLDMSFKFEDWDLSIIGRLTTDDVTVLSGKCTESDDPVYEYNIIKLTETELVLCFPADGADEFDEDGTCTYWYFKAVEE